MPVVPTMERSRASDRLLLVAFCLSGAAALGYEILWTRLLTLGLGSETLGVLGVLAGFFGGMALGSAFFHDRARRARDPLRLFIRLELAAAAFAAISPLFLHALAESLPAMLGPLAGEAGDARALVLAIAIAGITLLPGSACLGATLAALVEARRRSVPDAADGRGLGRLYAANTLGATFGVLVTVHWLLPRTGLVFGAVGLALVGVAAVLVARTWGARQPATQPVAEGTIAKAEAETSGEDPDAQAEGDVPDDPTAHIDTSGDPDPDVAREPWLLHGVLLGTGMVGVGLEVVGVRVLSQVLENTIYTFADTLAVYLLGTATGAALYARYATKAVAGRPAIVVAALLIAAALSCVIAGVAMAGAPAIVERIAGNATSVSRHYLAEAIVAGAAFGLPTIAMGALFSHVAGLLAHQGVGRAYALNTLGSAIAPFVFGVWAIESFGYRDALFVVVYAYVGIFGLFTWFRRFKPAWQIGAILAVVGATALGPSSLALVEDEDGWTELARAETLLGLVRVEEREGTDPPLRRLRVGKKFRMGGKLAIGERRMGQIPLVLAPGAERALFLGVGTGATLGAVTSHPLTQVDAVELVPAVLDQLHHFDAINGEVRSDERVTLHAADARRFVAASTQEYDVIVADLFHPARDGAGNLYAREHFDHLREHLAPGGVFVQWLPLYQLDDATLRTIVRTFLDVYGEAHSFLGIYNVQTPAFALVGRDPQRSPASLSLDLEALIQTLGRRDFAALLMSDARDLMAAYMLDRDALAAFAGDGPLTTDLRPRVAFDATAGAYLDDDQRGPTNIAALLEARTPLPPGLVTGADPARVAAFYESTARFDAALAHYLEAEQIRMRVRPGESLPAEAVDGYLEAHRQAPDFTAARGMLYSLAPTDRALAERIYPELVKITPTQPRAWTSYAGYLRAIGDTERLQRVLDEAKTHLEPAPPGG